MQRDYVLSQMAIQKKELGEDENEKSK